MASGATVKLGVEGISQFKSNMNQAKQAVKTLDAQLSLSEKQFKQTGDAESYMTEKTELLKAKLEQQKAVVDNAQKALDDMASRGVDRASKAYQDMYRQMITAKGALIDTENQLNGISESAEDAGNEVSSMNQQLKSIGNGVSFENVTNGLEKITDSMGSVIKKAWKVGEAIVQATLGAGQWADELDETASKYEMSPEQLYRMRQVADFIDTDVDTIITAQDKLSKNRAAKGKEFMGALAALGIDPTGKDDLTLFWEAGEALKNFGDAEGKVNYANALFGKSWRELLPLFKDGRKEYERLMNEKTSWIGDKNFEALTALDDASQNLNNEWETLQKTFMGTLAGPMQSALELMTGLLEQFNEYLQSDEGKQKMKELGETLTGWVKGLENVDFGEIIDKVKGAFDWIVDNAGSIVKAVEAIGIAFAGLKVVEFATNIWKIAEGFKFIRGGGNAGGGEAGGTGGTAAVKGGFWTGISNSLTGIAANGSAFLTASGIANMVPMVGDWFLNMTNAGRRLSDGGGVTELWEGLKEDVNEVKENIEHNAETFQDDWKNNAIVKKAEEIGRYNQVASDWTYGDEYTADELMAMVKAAEDITGASDVQKKSSTEMAEAAGTMKGLPGVIESAIIAGMAKIKINIDGQQAGNILTPYVNASMAGIVTAMTK